jgi:hypothetical protein
MNSLTPATTRRINLLTWEHQDPNRNFIGTYLVKMITEQASVDSQFSIKHLHEKLRDMPELIKKCGSDVKKFNEEVTNLVNSLAARQQ